MQTAVEIQSREFTLRGMLHRPEHSTGKVPLVVILHGFEGNKMGPHFIFVKLSRLLEQKGIASVRFDFAGSGESDGEFIQMTLTGELEDAYNILDYAKSLEFVDQQKIAVIGLSMGGAIASMLAGGRAKDIQSLCLWAPAGNMGGLVLQDIIGDQYGNFIAQGYHDDEGFLIGKDFVEEARELDIYIRAAAYNKHVLLLHGDKDEVVPLKASEMYAEIYGSKAKLNVLQGGNHTFDKKEWEEEVLASTVGFFAEELLFE